MSLGDIFWEVAKMSGLAFATGFAVCFFALPVELFRRMPRRIICLMLFIVVFRLVCPVSVSSRLSVHNLPVMNMIEEGYSLAGTKDGYVGDYQVAVAGTDAYNEAVDAGVSPQYPDDRIAIKAVVYAYDEAGGIIPAPTFGETYGGRLGAVWLAGVCLFMLYGAGSYVYMCRKVAEATLVEDNVYETDRIKTPFILGFVHPRIYLPLGLSDEQRRYVICHERCHIRHGDHIIKAVVYTVMCVHWFNIMLWIYFYRLFSSELELCCDGDVISELGEDCKADYGETLLSLSGRRHFIGAVPCAFGESDTKARVKQVLKYKKPTVLWSVVSVVLLIAATLLCGTDAMADNETVIHKLNYGDRAVFDVDFAAGVDTAGIISTDEGRFDLSGYGIAGCGADILDKYSLRTGKSSVLYEVMYTGGLPSEENVGYTGCRELSETDEPRAVNGLILLFRLTVLTE